jgi:L-fuconolactonase
MAEKIDAHQHFWKFSEADYGWITADMPALRGDFLPADLEAERKRCGIAGSVAVQARQSMEETRLLLELARDSDAVRGVVGWAPIAAMDFPAQLERLREEKKLKGLRHVIQDEADNDFILREDFNRGIALLAGCGLVYDILIFPRHLVAATKFVDAHQEQTFVLDHMAKPLIKEGLMEPWRTQILELGKRENVYCKISGIVTEANWSSWRTEDLQPYFDVVLEAFGPQRLMVGSDWPVCLLATSYQRWFETVGTFLKPLSERERELILGGVATDVYRLHSETTKTMRSESGR